MTESWAGPGNEAPGEGQTVLAGMEVRVKETGKCIENSIDKNS